MDARGQIADLVSVGRRGPGTDAERRAAQHLCRRLEALGREADAEPIWIRPSWPIVHTALALMGIVASVISTGEPVVAAIVAGVALAAAVADVGGRMPSPARLLTGRRASQNVVSRERGGRPGTLVLVAHHDAGRSGIAFGRIAEVGAALGRRLRRPIGPFGPVVWSLALVLACCVLRAAGIEATALAAVQFAATVVLIAAVALFADIALSDPVPGASDNASGVATVLRLAERYGGDLDHFDVWVLLPGAEEALGEGMRHWMKKHRRSLDPTRTVFVNVDTVGAGTVRFSRREGPLVTARMHPRLVALCDQIAAEDAGEGRYGARPVVMRGVTDALAARRRRFPAVTISCRDENDRPPQLHRVTDTPEHLDAAALERAYGFCSELIELIDEQIGPDVAAAVSAPEAFRPA
jgi:Peptidase family M28